MMAVDEASTLTALRTVRKEVFDPAIAEHGGRIVKTTGDGLLVEFPSAVDAMGCAMSVQSTLAASEERLRFRIGINVGDVVIEDGDILGDGVNIAARLEAVAEPGGVALSGAVREHVVGRIGAEFRDGGLHELKNIDRPIQVWLWEPAGVLSPATYTRTMSAPPLPNKPSVAVLPFDNMSGDPEQEYFADGVVESITAALSRIRSFFVIARNSAFAYKGRPMNIRDIGRELGVAYVLEGSVQRAGNRVRITVQLIETAGGAHIWAEKYDGALEDIFDLQDRITEQVAGAIQPSIRLAEVERTGRKAPQDLNAYDYAMRAMRHVWMLDEREATLALELLQKALAVDPVYPLALALNAWCHAQFAVYNWTNDHAGSITEALRCAELAAQGSGDDPLVLTVLGAVQSIARHQETARLILERAIALDPNSAWAWSRLAWVDVYTNNGERALERFEKALRLSPLDPINFNNHVGMGAALLSLGRYEESVAEFQRALRERPFANWIRRPLMTALSGAGRISEAREVWRELVARQPDFTIAKYLEAMPFPQKLHDLYAELLSAVESYEE
jgi:adenylate cyclase